MKLINGMKSAKGGRNEVAMILQLIGIYETHDLLEELKLVFN